MDSLLPPEVPSIAGSFLDPPSLFSCVQVCSTWYHTYLPHLWESIDDSLYSWPLILNKQQHYHDQHIGDKEETWLRDLYIKHGHLIRHLSIHWIPTLNAAGISNTCNRLPSRNSTSGNEYSRPPQEHWCCGVRELEVFRQQYDTEPIHLPQLLGEQQNFLLEILRGCPRLRVIDAIHHRIDAKLLIEDPFACESKLETFRCQVVGLERLYTDKMSRAGRGETAGVLTTTENMDEQLQKLQINVFEQLAWLTTTEDTGSGLRLEEPKQGHRRSLSSLPKCHRWEIYVNYGNPIEGTWT